MSKHVRELIQNWEWHSKQSVLGLTKDAELHNRSALWRRPQEQRRRMQAWIEICRWYFWSWTAAVPLLVVWLASKPSLTIIVHAQSTCVCPVIVWANSGWVIFWRLGCSGAQGAKNRKRAESEICTRYFETRTQLVWFCSDLTCLKAESNKICTCSIDQFSLSDFCLRSHAFLLTLAFS